MISWDAVEIKYGKEIADQMKLSPPFEGGVSARVKDGVVYYYEVDVGLAYYHVTNEIPEEWETL